MQIGTQFRHANNALFVGDRGEKHKLWTGRGPSIPASIGWALEKQNLRLSHANSSTTRTAATYTVAPHHPLAPRLLAAGNHESGTHPALHVRRGEWRREVLTCRLIEADSRWAVVGPGATPADTRQWHYCTDNGETASFSVLNMRAADGARRAYGTPFRLCTAPQEDGEARRQCQTGR